MASTKQFLYFILDQLSELEDISYRSMMGEYILYYRGKIFGGIYDDRLLVRNIPSALSCMDSPVLERPYEGARKMLLVEDIDNREYLKKLVREMYDELPLPRKRKAK